jgi:hypothetical protein
MDNPQFTQNKKKTLSSPWITLQSNEYSFKFQNGYNIFMNSHPCFLHNRTQGSRYAIISRKKERVSKSSNIFFFSNLTVQYCIKRFIWMILENKLTLLKHVFGKIGLRKWEIHWRFFFWNFSLILFCAWSWCVFFGCKLYRKYTNGNNDDLVFHGFESHTIFWEMCQYDLFFFNLILLLRSVHKLRSKIKTNITKKSNRNIIMHKEFLSRFMTFVPLDFLPSYSLHARPLSSICYASITV